MRAKRYAAPFARSNFRSEEFFCPGPIDGPHARGVMRLVDFFQALLDHVSVNLCCRNISVPQHELNGAQIRSPFQQMRGKAVTEFIAE